MLSPRLTVAIVLATCVRVEAAELPQAATLLDPDIVWDIDPDVIGEIEDPSAFAISPDDKLIAYISKGALWTCDVTTGPPTKLVELPNTKTAHLATPTHRAEWNNVIAAGNSTNHHIFLRSKLPDGMISVYGLAWTPSQDGIVYTLGKGIGERPWTVTYQVMHVSLEGQITRITTIKRDAYDEPNGFKYFHVTRDKKFVIASTGYSPLIWDTATNKPVATCFDVLIPSATSGRFLGIEIDTRQLVITDEAFKITQRFDVIMNWRRFCDLFWSPDERYAIVRNHIEHPSDKWVGFHIDLKTGKQRPLEGAHVAERWTFSSRGGEAVRTGRGSLITRVPDGDGKEHDVVRLQLPPNLPSNYWYKAGRYPPIRLSQDVQFFAMAMPSDGNNPGYRYYLVDRNGDKRPFAPNDASQRVSPYKIVAIANAGQTVVACDDTRLFSIPVEKIKSGGLAHED